MGKRALLDLSDYHTLTLTGGGSLLVDGRGVGTTRCREGTTFAGCLPGFSTAKACVEGRGRFSLLGGSRGTTLSKLKAGLTNPVRRTTARVTATRPRLTPLVSSLDKRLNTTLPTLSRMKGSLMSTLHASAEGMCTNTVALARPLCVNNGVHTCGGVAGCTRRLTRRRRRNNVRRMVVDASRTC